MPFGRFKGRTLLYIADHHPLYLDWLIGLRDLRNPLKSHVSSLCDEYAHIIDARLEALDLISDGLDD